MQNIADFTLSSALTLSSFHNALRSG